MKSGNMFLLYNATVVTGESAGNGSVAVSGDKISAVWYPEDDETISFFGKKIPYGALTDEFRKLYPEAVIYDLSGKLLMAGGIDTHVHFREPGLTEKADMASESLAAITGGVTSFVDMPNTTPPTISAERLAEKINMAEGRSYTNFGFHIGATNSNFNEISAMLESKEGAESFGGIKVFMGSSTGNMLVDNESALERIFRNDKKEVLVHCEDESIIRKNISEAQEKFGEEIPFSEHENIRSRKACIKSSAKALEMAIKYGTRLHLLHVSTAEEVEMVRAAKSINSGITAETSVNYLWFCDDDYEKMGSRLKCNPSVKTGKDREALINALRDGTIDSIGSDHAPHLAAEKNRKYLTAPSGLPSVQQSLSVLLTIAGQEDIPLTRIASAFSERVAEMFGIEGRGKIKEGFYADIVIVDPERKFTVNKDSLKYKCGWSPYEGIELKGYVERVFISGKEVIKDGCPDTGAVFGKRLIFNR